MNGNGNGNQQEAAEEVLKKFLDAVESYHQQLSSEKKEAAVVIDGESDGVTENFLCVISSNPNRGEKQGLLKLGFQKDDSIGKVSLTVSLPNGDGRDKQFVFPLKYVVGYRAWYLEVPCRYSGELTGNLDRAVYNGAVRIEAITKKKGVNIEDFNSV